MQCSNALTDKTFYLRDPTYGTRYLIVGELHEPDLLENDASAPCILREHDAVAFCHDKMRQVLVPRGFIP